MLRITKASSGSVTKIKIEGRLASNDVSELEMACQSVQGSIGLDLSDLTATDAEGVRTLKRLLAGGARLLAASPYMKALLESKDT